MKGSAGKFIIMLVFLAFFSFFHIAFNEAYNPLHTWAGTAITDADSVNTISILNIMWTWFPVAVLFSYFIYSVSKAQQERGVWP